jgi:hypothetical protein
MILQILQNKEQILQELEQESNVSNFGGRNKVRRAAKKEAKSQGASGKDARAIAKTVVQQYKATVKDLKLEGATGKEARTAAMASVLAKKEEGSMLTPEEQALLDSNGEVISEQIEIETVGIIASSLEKKEEQVKAKVEEEVVAELEKDEKSQTNTKKYLVMGGIALVLLGSTVWAIRNYMKK